MLGDPSGYEETKTRERTQKSIQKLRLLSINFENASTLMTTALLEMESKWESLSTRVLVISKMVY